MRRSAVRILGREFDVSLAVDMEGAWARLLEDPLIQVVFSDLVDKQGQEDLTLLERTRSSASRRVRETPVVVIIDDDDSDQHRENALAAGATDFIDKPFRPAELLARARAHATHADAVRRLRLLKSGNNSDQYTGLGNRRYFFERLAQALSFARRHKQALSLVHVHIDGLARALAELPDSQSSQRLAELGRALSRAVRREDTVYRTGPETFSFILPGTSAEGADVVRYRLIPELDTLGLLDGRTGLEVNSRFDVQAPELGPDESVVECLRRVRRDMGAVLVDSPDASLPEPPDSAPQKATGTAGLDLDTLLEKARRGELEEIRQHLPDLMARLKPLLDMAADGQRSTDSKPGSGPNPDDQSG